MKGGTKVVRGFLDGAEGHAFRGLQNQPIQSIIGATEKRRESGAGVAVIGGIGVSGMGEAGRWRSLSGLGFWGSGESCGGSSGGVNTRMEGV